MTESISEKLSFMRDIAQEFILKVLFPLLEKADLYTEFMRSASRLSIRWLRDVEQTTPAAPVKGTGPFYLMARPPLLDQGGEFAGTGGVTCVQGQPFQGGETMLG